MKQNACINRCCKIVDNASRSQLNEIVQIGADTLPLIDVVILPADDGHSKMNKLCQQDVALDCKVCSQWCRVNHCQPGSDWMNAHDHIHTFAAGWFVAATAQSDSMKIPIPVACLCNRLATLNWWEGAAKVCPCIEGWRHLAYNPPGGEDCRQLITPANTGH